MVYIYLSTMEITVYKIFRMCANGYAAVVCKMFDMHV